MQNVTLRNGLQEMSSHIFLEKKKKKKKKQKSKCWLLKLLTQSKKIVPLRNHTYSNILKILEEKKRKFSDKKF